MRTIVYNNIIMRTSRIIRIYLIQVLLSYRASPNYRDAKGLTPVFHTAIMGDDTAACATLLRHRAELGCTDHGGWTELHHVSMCVRVYMYMH